MMAKNALVPVQHSVPAFLGGSHTISFPNTSPTMFCLVLCESPSFQKIPAVFLCAVPVVLQCVVVAATYSA